MRSLPDHNEKKFTSELSNKGYPPLLTYSPLCAWDNTSESQCRYRKGIYAIFTHLLNMWDANILLQGGKHDDICCTAFLTPLRVNEITAIFVWRWRWHCAVDSVPAIHLESRKLHRPVGVYLHVGKVVCSGGTPTDQVGFKVSHTCKEAELVLGGLIVKDFRRCCEVIVVSTTSLD